MAGGLLTFISSRAFADLYDDYINSTSKRPFVSFLTKAPAPV
jgi:hypothetical protein